MVPMGTSGRSAWGAASVTRAPGSRWYQSVGIKAGLTYPAGPQQHCLLRNKKVLGRVQAIQVNIDAATPNVSVIVASPRAARVDPSGSAAEGAVGAGTAEVRYCRGCWLAGGWELARASLGRVPQQLWSSHSLSTARLDTEMSTRTPYLPPAVPRLCCLHSHFQTYATTRGQKQPAEKRNSRRHRQPGSPWGSLKCPKLENWPPPPPASCNIIIPA